MNTDQYKEQLKKQISKEEKTNRNLVIILTILVVFTIIIGAIVVGLVAFPKSDGSDGQNKTTAAQTHPVLVVDKYPEQVDSTSPMVTLSGTIRDNNTTAVLTINGETVCKYLSSDIGTEKEWEWTVTLSAGTDNKFEIKLCNSYDKTDIQTCNIFCRKIEKQESPANFGPLQSGCEFVKKRPGGLNIRSYAGTEYSIVDYIDDNDYTSRMTFTGNYSTDSDSYIWYQVFTPKGKVGYVRSDLVKRVN